MKATHLGLMTIVVSREGPTRFLICLRLGSPRSGLGTWFGLRKKLRVGIVQCRLWMCCRLGSSDELYPGTVLRERWVPSHLSNPRADANPGGPRVCRLGAHEVNGDCLRTVWSTATRSPVDGGCLRKAWSTATRPPARVQIACRRTARSLEICCTRECQQTGWDPRLRHPLRGNEVRGGKPRLRPPPAHSVIGGGWEQQPRHPPGEEQRRRSTWRDDSSAASCLVRLGCDRARTSFEILCVGMNTQF